MRRSIGYTGRRKIAQSSVDVKLYESEVGKRVSLTIASPSAFESMSLSSKVKLRFFENHFTETLVFGTLGEVSDGVEPLEMENHDAFSAPSVQLRVVESEGNRRGIVLGSTRRWTLRMNGEDQTGNISEGILLLQRRNISPRIWKLDIREDEQPVVYIDSTIRNPYAWARSDAVFASCVFPAVIKEIFDYLYGLPDLPEQQWAIDWMDWAETLLPERFNHSADEEDYEDWINRLIDRFCGHHDLLGKLRYRLEEGDSK